MKKITRNFIYLILFALLIWGFIYLGKKDFSSTITDAERFSKEYTTIEKDNPFVYVGSNKVLEILNNETGIILVGFSSNAWMQEYVRQLYPILKENNIFFKTQYTFNDLKKENLLRFDFAIFENENLMYLIEYQGEQHYIPYHFDTQKRFEKRLEYDNAKKEYCKQNHIPLIIIPYTDFDKIDIQYLNKKYQEVKNI